MSPAISNHTNCNLRNGGSFEKIIHGCNIHQRHITRFGVDFSRFFFEAALISHHFLQMMSSKLPSVELRFTVSVDSELKIPFSKSDIRSKCRPSRYSDHINPIGINNSHS